MINFDDEEDGQSQQSQSSFTNFSTGVTQEFIIKPTNHNSQNFDRFRGGFPIIEEEEDSATPFFQEGQTQEEKETQSEFFQQQFLKPTPNMNSQASAGNFPKKIYSTMETQEENENPNFSANFQYLPPPSIASPKSDSQASIFNPFQGPSHSNWKEEEKENKNFDDDYNLELTSILSEDYGFNQENNLKKMNHDPFPSHLPPFQSTKNNVCDSQQENKYNQYLEGSTKKRNLEMAKMEPNHSLNKKNQNERTKTSLQKKFKSLGNGGNPFPEEQNEPKVLIPPKKKVQAQRRPVENPKNEPKLQKENNLPEKKVEKAQMQRKQENSLPKVRLQY